MDLLDRLSYLLRSALDETEDDARRDHTRHHRGDPDWREAWNELDDYMRRATDPGAADGAGPGSAGARGGAGRGSAGGGAAGPGSPGGRNPMHDAALRRAYETLEVRPGASLDEVRRQFRRELARYHPDRFADDPDKFAAATAVTRELIQSYRRIRDYYNAGGL